MGLFGGKKKMGGLFGAPGSYATPGIGDDIERQRRGLLGDGEGERPKRFWQGGDKFTGRDAIAGILAVIGDVAAQQSGGEPGAVDMLTGSRFGAIEQARKAQQQAQEIAAARQRAQAAGLAAPQADMLAHGDAKYGDFRTAPNDTERDYNFWQQHLTPEQFELWKQGRYDPMVSIPLPGNQVYAGPRSGLGSAFGSPRQGALPSAPVGRLTPIGPSAMGTGGGVSPESEQMRQAYITQLGPQQGEVAFREWMQKMGRQR